MSSPWCAHGRRCCALAHGAHAHAALFACDALPSDDFVATLNPPPPLCCAQEERRASLGRYSAATAPPARVRPRCAGALLNAAHAYTSSFLSLALSVVCTQHSSLTRAASLPAHAHRQAQAEVDSAIDSRLTALLG
jgi:hypothetical protein